MELFIIQFEFLILTFAFRLDVRKFSLGEKGGFRKMETSWKPLGIVSSVVSPYFHTLPRWGNENDSRTENITLPYLNVFI